MRALFYTLVSLAALSLLAVNFFQLSLWVDPEFYFEMEDKQRKAVSRVQASDRLNLDDLETARVYADDGGGRLEFQRISIPDITEYHVAVVETTETYKEHDGLFYRYINPGYYIFILESRFLSTRFCLKEMDECTFDEGKTALNQKVLHGVRVDQPKRIVNLAVGSRDGSDSGLVFEDKVMVDWFTESPIEFNGLAISFADTDTNEDGQLTELDQKHLGIYSFESGELQKFVLPGSLLSIGPGEMPMVDLPISYLLDANGDGRYDPGLDTVRLAILNLETGDVTPEVSDDLLLRAQQIVDGD